MARRKGSEIKGQEKMLGDDQEPTYTQEQLRGDMLGPNDEFRRRDHKGVETTGHLTAELLEGMDYPDAEEVQNERAGKAMLESTRGHSAIKRQREADEAKEAHDKATLDLMRESTEAIRRAREAAGKMIDSNDEPKTE